MQDRPGSGLAFQAAGPDAIEHRPLIRHSTMVMIMVIAVPRHTMKTIQASEFKAKCLALMDEVARSGEVLVVTKNGRPVAELRPYSGGRALSPFGLHRELRIRGDILSPIDDEAWSALE